MYCVICDRDFDDALRDCPHCDEGSCSSVCYVSADWILENMWQFPNETWWEATLNGKHRQFVRIRLDIEAQEYVLDAVWQDRKYSEGLWRYKGGDWQFLSHNPTGQEPPTANDQADSSPSGD
jgi:hypothetical protein